MKKLFKIAAKLLLLLVLLVIMSFFIDKGLYYEFIMEDGLIEYLTALLLLVISVLLIIKMVKVRYSRGCKWLVFNILIALGLFFGFGEEISWGQRIFEVTSSDFFMENNLQKETNLHNLDINGLKINKWVFSYGFSILFGIYFLLSLVIYKKHEFVKKNIDEFGIPLPKVFHSIIFIVITIAIMIIPDDGKWELWECLFAIVLLMIFLEPYNSAEKLLL